MKRNLLAWAVSVALALSLAGCKAARPADGPAETSPVLPPVAAEAPAPAKDDVPAPADVPAPEEDGQNPVMNVIGLYHAEDCKEALVEAEGMENARITVTYAPSPWFHDQTVMSGRFDPETLAVDFSDGAMTEFTYNSDGSVNGTTVYYENGTGRAVFDPADNTLTITRVTDDGSSETTVFTWGAAPDMKTVTDPEHYAAVTAMDKAQVETVIAYAARTAYLSENWFALADMIRYPITVNGDELADSAAFVEYMQDKTLSDSDRQAMSDEDLLDMFVNGQGICLGSGQIWLNDPNYMTDRAPELQVIAISGIVSAGEAEPPVEEDETDPAPAPEAGTGRRDGERFEGTVVLEGMEETVVYEHVRSGTAGIEMDYDCESLVRRSDGDRECFLSIYDDPDDPENYLEVRYDTGNADLVADALAATLSGEYEVLTETWELEQAGSCLRIDASRTRDGGLAERMQMVYIIPAPDGCRIATAHYTIESAEGFGHRFHAMLDTLSVIER